MTMRGRGDASTHPPTAPGSAMPADTAIPTSVPPAPIKSHAAFTEAMQAAEHEAAHAEASLPSCVERLRTVRQLVKDDEAMRVDKEGTAITARPTPNAPRFAPAALTSALQSAFAGTQGP